MHCLDCMYLCLPQLYLTSLKHVVSFPLILLCRFESINGFNNRAISRLQNDEKNNNKLKLMTSCLHHHHK